MCPLVLYCSICYNYSRKIIVTQTLNVEYIVMIRFSDEFSEIVTMNYETAKKVLLELVDDETTPMETYEDCANHIYAVHKYLSALSVVIENEKEEFSEHEYYTVRHATDISLALGDMILYCDEMYRNFHTRSDNFKK